MRAVLIAREILRDAFPGVVDRLTAAGTLGAMGLSLAGFETPDTKSLIMACCGAGGVVFALLVWGRAPDDPDLPPV